VTMRFSASSRFFAKIDLSNIIYLGQNVTIYFLIIERKQAKNNSQKRSPLADKY
jgi:hypothetical protein